MKNLALDQITFIDRLKKDIKIIEDEVTELMHQEDIFQKYIKPDLNKQSAVVAIGITKAHYSSALVAIRRQTGIKKNEVSLMHLLSKLSSHNTWITEDWYTDNWLGQSELISADTDPVIKKFTEGIPVQEFRDHFGTEGFLNKNKLEDDINKLKNATNIIKSFVDKRVAHRDKKENILNPRDEHYLEALKTIENLTSKYILLLKQVGMPSLTPVLA